MRRAQTDLNSQAIRNLAYNPSFEASGISAVLRTNIAQNPSLETAGATTAVRTNILTNPSAEVSATNVNVRTNLALNPSFEGTSGVTNVRTNLVANPGFESTTSTVNVRTNLSPYPNMEVGSGATTMFTNLCINPRGVQAYIEYQSAASQTISANVAITGNPDGFTTANRVTYTNGSNPGVMLVNPLIDGQIYTAQCWVYHESIEPTAGSQGLAQAGVTSMPSPPAIVQGVWQKITWTFTASTTNYMGYRVSSQSGGSGSFLITGVMVEAVGVLNTFYDGATAASGDFTYTWAGTANASVSRRNAPVVTGWTARWFGSTGQGVAYQSKTGVTGNCYRKFWTKDATGSPQDIGINTAQLTVLPNTNYTSSISMRCSIVTHCSVYVIWYDASAVQIGGTVGATDLGAVVANAWTRFSNTFTSPSNAAFAVFLYGPYVGATVPMPAGTTLDFDQCLIETGLSPAGTYFDGAIPISNLATNPSFETDTTGWLPNTGSPTLTADSAQKMFGTKSLKMVSTISSADIAAFFSATLTPNTTYTLSYYVYSPDARTSYFDAAATNYNASNLGSIAIPANTWTRVSATFTTTSTITGTTTFYLHNGAGPTTIGTALWIDGVLLERSATVNPYYEGTGDFTYAWTGVANSSTSVQQAPSTQYYVQTSTSSLYQSSISPQFGSKCAGVMTRGGNGDGLYYTDIAVTPGASYTFSAYVKLTTTVPNFSIDFRWKDSGQVILSDPITEVSGSLVVGSWVRISATSVAPTAAAFLQPMLRVYASHTPTTFYADGVLIERASGLDSYFDGATAAAGDFTYAWSGTVNASTSYQQAPTIANWSPRWFGSNGGNGATYQAKGGLTGTYARKVWTTANTGATMDAGIGTATSVPITASTVYTFSAWARASFGQYMNYYIEWKDAGNATISATQMSTGTLLTANTWTRLSVTATSPSNAVAAYFILTPYAQAIATPYGGTIDFDNVLIEAAPGVQDYFDGANPIQNLVTNPSFATDTAGWTGSLLVSGNGRVTTKSYSGVGSIWGVANDNLGDSMFVNTTGIGVAAFATYTVSAYAYVPAGVVASDFRGSTRNLWAVSFDGATPTTATANLDFSKTNQWQRVSTTITIPSNSTSGLSIRLYCPANSLGIFWDAVQVEKTSVLNPYYEGTGDYNYVWAGTANASVSYQQAPGVSGMSSVGYLGMAYQSKTYGITSGAKAIRITPTNVSNGDSFAEINGMLGSYTFKANTTYTISGNRTILAPQTNVGGTNHFRINIGTELTPTLVTTVANVAGTQRVVGRFTTGGATNLAFVRLYNGSFFGGGDVWWDDIFLEEGTTNGTYFDGANPIQNLVTNPSFETTTSPWNAPNGSTLAVSSAQSFVGTKSALVTLPTSGSASFSGAGYSIALSANTTYTLSGWVYIPTTGGCPVVISVQSSGWLSAQSSAVTATGVWTRLSVTFTTVLAQTYALYFLNGAASTAGQVFYLDAVLLERGPVLNYYYEGLGDFTYAWTGTANASTSEQRGVLPSDRQAPSANSAVYQSSVRAVTGTKSGAIRAKADVLADSTLMYPVNEYFTDSGTGRLTPSVPNTWSLYVWVPSGSGTVRLQDTTSGTIGAPNTTFNQWERISVTFTAPATGASILRLRANTTVPAGTVIWWDNELLEGSPAALPYFDGSTGTVGDYTHAWVGTANASSSQESALGLTNYPGAAAAIVSSTDWSTGGVKSLRITPTTTSADTFATAPYTLETGKTYTISGNVRLKAPQTGTLDNASRARKIVIYHSGTSDQSSATANTAGVGRVSVTFKVTDGSVYQSIRLYAGSSAGNGDVWWDDLMIVEGTYTGDYVDGTKPFSKWDGAANLSTSVGYPPQYLDIAGKPDLDFVGIGSSVSPTVNGFAARTVYFVYETTNDGSGSWAVPYFYGSAAPSTGLTLQTAAGGNFTVSPRLDFTSGSGDINKGFNFPNGRTLSRRHVLAMSFNQGLTSLGAHGDGAVLTGPGTINPGSVGWTNGQIRSFSNAYVKGIYAAVFYAEHDAATRLAISRYLGNKYGAAVA